MPRERFQTLSEPMYYVLLALMEECCGVDIMNKAVDISGGRVIVGPGTVYAMLEKFLKSGVIRETSGRGSQGRKRSYRIADYGKDLLRAEYVRLEVMVSDGRRILEERP